jgi:hypothetical protein
MKFDRKESWFSFSSSSTGAENKRRMEFDTVFSYAALSMTPGSISTSVGLLPSA